MVGLNLEPEGPLEMDNNHITNRIDTLIKRLSKPLTSVDTQDGWTDEAKDAALALLQRLQSDIHNEVQVREIPEYRSLARGLDHWGIESGEVLEDFAELSQSIRQYVKNPRRES